MPVGLFIDLGQGHPELSTYTEPALTKEHRMLQRTFFTSIVWSAGFRPFFLSAGLFATLIIPMWLLYLFGFVKYNYYGSWWHGHEMIYGYLASVLGGFLLTAVQNWTGKPTAQGGLLFYLWLMWVLARLLPWIPALQMHPIFIAAVDVIFLPCLAVAIGIALVTQKQVRNYGFAIALLLLGAINVLFHWAVISGNEQHIRVILHIGLLLMLWMMIKLGCRVIPFFTERGLQINGLSRNNTHDALCEFSVLLMLPAAGLSDNTTLASALLVIVAIVMAMRFRQWLATGLWQQPLLWILHIAFVWFMAGLIFMALEQSGVLPYSGSWHAITIGMMGCLTLGMMARISLGHTGRTLEVSSLMVAAFYLINVAAVARVLAAYIPSAFFVLLIVAGVAWMLSFLLFVWVYLPILSKPRPTHTGSLC